MYLAYIDDSDTKCKAKRWQVMAAVLIDHRDFKFAEIGMGVAQEVLGLSPEKLEKFEEFHACELYGGYGFFEGIDQEIRFDAMRRLLYLLSHFSMHVVYGAVDLEKLGNEIYASADPVDICFRVCLKGVPECLGAESMKSVTAQLDEEELYKTEKIIPILLEHTMRQLAVVIVDDCDKKIKDSLHKTFRSIRPKRTGADTGFSSFHDDMYFGDSKYSLGIQLADACSYFIACHLEGDPEKESFYELIKPHIVYHEIHPKADSLNIESAIESQEG
jgi:hypothetical protein